MLHLKRKLVPKKGRRVRKIEFPIDTPIEFELGIQLLTYSGGGRRDNRGRRGSRRKPEWRKLHTQKGRATKKCLVTEE